MQPQPQFPFPSFADESSGWRFLFPVTIRNSFIETISLSLKAKFSAWRSPEMYRQRAVEIEKTIFLFASDAQDYDLRIQRGLRGLDAQSRVPEDADEASPQAAVPNPLSVADLFPDEPEYVEWFSTEQAFENLMFEASNWTPPAPSPPVQVCPITGALQTEAHVRDMLALQRHPDFFTTGINFNDELWSSIQDLKNKFVPAFPWIYEILVDMLKDEDLTRNPMATTENLGKCLQLLHLEFPAQVPQDLAVEFVERVPRYIHRVVSAYSEKLLDTINEHPERTQDHKKLLAEFIEECVQGCAAQRSSK